MSDIITCLVRGGEAGRKVQNYTISFAAEHNKEILFIHVIDITPLDGQSEAMITAMQSELEWLGKVILNMAVHRAKLSGISAEGVILYGTVLKAVIAHLSDHATSSIFIGSPHPDTPDYSLRLEKVHQFARRLEESTGSTVEVIPS